MTKFTSKTMMQRLMPNTSWVMSSTILVKILFLFDILHSYAFVTHLIIFQTFTLKSHLYISNMDHFPYFAFWCLNFDLVLSCMSYAMTKLESTTLFSFFELSFDTSSSTPVSFLRSFLNSFQIGVSFSTMEHESHS